MQQKTSGRYTPGQERALSLWVVMHRALAALTKVSEEDIRSRGFSITEWGVLEYLHHKGRQTLARVGEQILITSGSVTYVIDKLEGKGLIQRVPCECDRRAIYAELTDQGETLMKREFPFHAEAIRQMLSTLDAEEQEQLKSLLKKVGGA